MGTRGLLGHIVRSKNIRKGTYNHFDSYPAGLGVDIAKFINSLSDEQLEKMKKMLAKMEWIDFKDEGSEPPQEVQEHYVKAGVAQLEHGKDWYWTLRRAQGAAALPLILDGTLTHSIDQTDFESDGLFCEYAYWIDWEEKTVTVKRGRHQDVISFAELSPERIKQSN